MRRRARAAWRCLVAATIAVTFFAAPALARSAKRPPPQKPLFARGQQDGSLPTVRLNRAVLRDTGRGRGVGRFRVAGVPLRQDLEVELELERFYVTRSDTRFVLGRKDGPDEELDFDPDEVALFRGSVRGRPGSRVVLALREGRHAGSIDLGPGERRYWLSSRGRSGQDLAPDRASVFEAAGAPELPPGVPFCGVEGDAFDPVATTTSLVGASASSEPEVGLLHMELAVDTDYEFFQLFEDAGDAAAYLVALYGQVSDIYLRDVDTRVELVFARIWETPDDLFNEVDPSPLGDFQSHWNTNMGGVQRDVAQLLSGRRNYPFGGQAYLSSMCGSSGYGVVGYAQGYFPDPTQPSPFSYDISVTAHELGHNAGTGHTHDSPNFIDTCDDPLTTPQRGTIMSYCSQTWSGGNANRDLYFHGTIQQNIDSHLGGSSCIVDDCNQNGVADSLDISGATSADVNSNGIPDECEDCDDNGTLDPEDIALGAPDVDGDGVPDVCEPDCNANGVPDDRDISLGTSLDAYGNDIPDECEADCNTNTTSDYTEIQLDMSLDIDRNALLDSCQDCDGDTTPDLVELAGAHGMWMASGETASSVRRFHARTGVLSATSSGGAGAAIAEGQDLIVTAAGRVLVSSAADDRVAEFDGSGVYQGDLVGGGSGGLDHPAGLVLSPTGELLVASHATDEVLRYDASSGAFLGVFVTAGLGGLTGPFGLAFGPNGNLYVTREDGGVMEYDGTTGALVGTFVDPLANGGLSLPRGLLFKPDGNLLVTSYGSDETHEYVRGTGFPLGPWAKSGTSTRLNQDSPWGLRIAPSGNVFIVRTGEAFGPGGGGEHDHLHLTNAQVYEFDVRNGNFLRAHVNGNDHGMEFPTGFDFLPGFAIDCNVNQVQDSCDIASGSSQDLDSSSVPDECEIDCNTNGNLDRLDIIPFGSSTDCNTNLVPDECDSAAGVPGACEVAVEVSCADGFDNDRDGLRDCNDTDCDATGACLGGIVAAVTFEAGAELFSYQNDPFRGTSQPAYATGVHAGAAGFEGGGALSVTLGGVDGADILGMSGGWQRSFTLAAAADVSLTFRFRMDHEQGYESDEFSQVLVALDGALVGNPGGEGGPDYIVQLTGDGQGGNAETRTTGWQTVTLDLGNLAAGSHTVTLGGYNNKKTLADEFTTIWFDSIAITTVVAPVCGDGTVSPGEDCDDGGTADGDCCSSTCAFEASGSACDDADACTDSDGCDGAGVCGGAPVICDDGDVCTVGMCDSMIGCSFTPIPGCPVPVPAAGPWGRLTLAALLFAGSLVAMRRVA